MEIEDKIQIWEFVGKPVHDEKVTESTVITKVAFDPSRKSISQECLKGMKPVFYRQGDTDIEFCMGDFASKKRHYEVYFGLNGTNHRGNVQPALRLFVVNGAVCPEVMAVLWVVRCSCGNCTDKIRGLRFSPHGATGPSSRMPSSNLSLLML